LHGAGGRRCLPRLTARGRRCLSRLTARGRTAIGLWYTPSPDGGARARLGQQPSAAAERPVRQAAERSLDPQTLSANLGAVATLLLGCLGLFFPSRAAAFTSIAPIGRTGVSEIRATYGGLFAALGLACLALQSLAVFSTAGVAWMGAAAGRAWSALIDGNREAKNLGGIVFELLLGLLLLAPWWAAA